MQTSQDPILISWISEWAYCQRRFFLQTVENIKTENQFVAEGTLSHQKVHSETVERRGRIIKVSGLHVYSVVHNLYGICDVVEFEISEKGSYIPFLDKICEIHPVEYKHGKIRNETEYNLQMAAQSICLEEMFDIKIDKGYVYYIGSKTKFEVNLTKDIRDGLNQTILEIAQFLKNPYTIKPELRKRCNGCSLKDVCNPRKVLVADYMETLRKKYGY